VTLSEVEFLHGWLSMQLVQCFYLKKLVFVLRCVIIEMISFNQHWPLSHTVVIIAS
jgi:hypothetical protein